MATPVFALRAFSVITTFSSAKSRQSRLSAMFNWCSIDVPLVFHWCSIDSQWIGGLKLRFWEAGRRILLPEKTGKESDLGKLTDGLEVRRKKNPSIFRHYSDRKWTPPPALEQCGQIKGELIVRPLRKPLSSFFANYGFLDCNFIKTLPWY